jgi:hypothetical protein
MGGIGSNRWGWHNKRATVESCRRFTVRQVLNGPGLGRLSWNRGGSPSGNISYLVTYENGQPQRLRLMYTITYQSGAKVDIDYSMPFVTTFTPWGSPRYWLLCPDCGRRCRTLYDPPNGQRYTCRLCGNLTYKSSQEEHYFDSFYKHLAASMGGKYTPEDIRYSFGEGSKKQRQAWAEKSLRQLNDLYPDPYQGYLTAAELLDQSGLTPADLAGLESVRLLLPDHGGRYRPKLAGWARKLAYLIREGWSLAELQAWARGRWSTPNPRAWPPSREDWQESGNV